VSGESESPGSRKKGDWIENRQLRKNGLRRGFRNPKPRRGSRTSGPRAAEEKHGQRERDVKKKRGIRVELDKIGKM